MKTGKWGLLGILLACATILSSVAIVAPIKRPRPVIVTPDGTSPMRVPFPAVTPMRPGPSEGPERPIR